MPLRTVSNAGGNWNATATWTGGVVPIAGDTVAFTATSGNLTVNVASATLTGIDFTNYVNTITFTNAIISTGTINLGTGGFTQAGTSGLIVSGTATISGTTVWSRTLTFTGANITYTLGSNLTVTGDISFSGATSSTFTGNNFNIGGNLTVTTTATIIGTTVFNFNGTGTWNHTNAGAIRNNTIINTTGTLTLGANIYYNTGTLTYTSGTVDTTTNNSTLNIGVSTTLDTDRGATQINWNNILISSLVQTLTSNLNCQNLTLTNTSAVTFTNSGGNVYISGNLLFTSNGTTVGTASINLIGTGSWNHTSTGQIRNNLIINTTGTITLGANVYYNTGTLTYILGTVDTTTNNSTLNISVSTILDTSGMAWNNVLITVGIQTLTSDLNILNLTVSNPAGVTFTNSGGNIYISGNLLHTGTGAILGTASINLIGIGTWNDTSSQDIRNNLNINTTGTITLGTNVNYITGTLTYISGTVDTITNNSTLNIGAASTLNTNGINWNNVTITTGTQTLTSNLNCQNLTSGTSTINGLFNVNVNGNLTASGITQQGTATIVLIGTGLWTATNASNTFRTSVIINTNGVITLPNILYHDGNLTYIKGIVKSNNTSIEFGSTIKTLINMHKLIFKNVILGAGITYTMNEFFSGSAGIVTNISSSGANYTISFQDNFEKIAKFVNISNCTLTKPLQLLVITKSKKSSTNVGIRYINQSPNGIAKGDSTVDNVMTFGAGGLLSDPNMR